MQIHAAYSNVPEPERLHLLAKAHMARLVTLPAGGGWPRIGLFPYVYEAGRFEIHLPRPDPQLADPGRRPALHVRGGRCALVHPGRLAAGR